MDILSLIIDYIVCFFACFAFTYILNAPKKARIPASHFGAVGYIIYLICLEYINMPTGFFLGTLFMSIASEVSARVMKMPATALSTPAIVSLVPGGGIYYSMMHFVRHETAEGIAKTVETLINAGAMAMALACTSVAFKIFKFYYKKAKKIEQ